MSDWTNITPSAATWSAQAAPRDTWQQLEPLAGSDDEVDFTLRVNDTWPLRVVDADPNYVIDRSERP